jgi:hypothetical protein
MYLSCTIILLLYGSRKQNIQSYRSYVESPTEARTTPKIPHELAHIETLALRRRRSGSGSAVAWPIDTDKRGDAQQLEAPLVQRRGARRWRPSLRDAAAGDSLTRRGSRSRTGMAVGKRCWPVLEEAETLIGATSCAPAAGGQHRRCSAASQCLTKHVCF